MSWQITAPRLTKEERKAIAQADAVTRRRQNNKAARKSRRTNREGSSNVNSPPHPHRARGRLVECR
jgi:hypothetical protein